MADKKISALTPATTPLAGTEVLPIVQSGTTVKVSVNNLTAGKAVSATQFTSTIATGTAPLVVTSTTEVANLRSANATSADTANQVKSNATTGVLQVTGPAVGTTRVMTTPNADFTAARTDAAQSFTGTQTFNGQLTKASADNSTSTGIRTDQLVIDNTFTATGTTGAQSAIFMRVTNGSTAHTGGMALIDTGGNSDFSAALAFYTRSGAGTLAEVGRWTGSGNFGIGVNPTYKLDLTDATTSTDGGGIRLTLGSEGRSHLITNSTPNASSGRDLGVLAWRSLKLKAGNGTTEGVLANQAYEHITFETGSSFTERARVTSGGYFKASNTGTYALSTTGTHEFNQSANTAICYFYGTNNSLGQTVNGIAITYSNASPNDVNQYFVYCSDSTALRAGFRSNGGLANYQANDANLSDRREKINFAPAKNYLDTICAIPVQTFNYIDQNHETDPGLTLGVVAQDVQAVAPELVTESNWAKEGEEPKMRLSIYQTDLQYALMKCIQELKAELDSVKVELNQLKGK